MPDRRTLFMQTTEVPEARSIAQIQACLAVYGADAVMIEYEDGGKVKALSFRLQVNGHPIPVQLPCRWQQVRQQLKGRTKRWRSDQEWEPLARRVAWRQLYRWVEAQMALIEAGMVKMQEVFLPYITVGINETLYQRLESKQFLLEGPATRTASKDHA